MRKNTRWLLVLCILAVAGVFLLQFFWIKNYYYVNRATFEKEVNLAFEDATKKEFEVRCDTIEKHLFQLLSDTAEFNLSNTVDPKTNRVLFQVMDRKKPGDRFYFHTDSMKEIVAQNDTGAGKLHLAKFLSHQIRINDLADHFTLFRTQKLGEFILTQERIFGFDTARLRPILKHLLEQRDIVVPFVFYLRSKDSTNHINRFQSGLIKTYPVITRASLIYKPGENYHYVRALFVNPFGYIIAKMGAMFLASLLLIGVVAFSLFYLLRSLLTEKKLALIKNDFISNITHELKTPIATVSAAVESLSDFDVLNDKEKAMRYLVNAKSQLQRLAGLVDTILTSTLYENPEFKGNYEQLDVDEVINNVIHTYQNGPAPKAAITWQNLSETGTIRADRLLFRQSLDNIIDNSVKYAGENVQINITATAENSFFVIKITDNGKGIAKENLPFLFEKFYRVPGNAHKVKGHGLGLNFVKNIMERHSGWCRAESALGSGTTLILGWPI